METNIRFAVDTFDRLKEHKPTQPASPSEAVIARAKTVSCISGFLDYAFHPDLRHVQA